MSVKQVHRMGDPNDKGGIIEDIPQSTVFANGKLVAVDGSKGSAHFPFTLPHNQNKWQTANGNSKITIEGKPINVKGHNDSCGHPRDAGSPNVNAEA